MYSAQLNRRLFNNVGVIDKLDNIRLYNILHSIPTNWISLKEPDCSIRYKYPKNYSAYLYHHMRYNILYFEENSKDIIDWCKKNCLDDFGFKYSDVWYFKTKEDKIQFLLVWK